MTMIDPKILIVDENSAIPESLHTYMRDRGCLVLSLSNPNRIEQYLAEENSDLILMDLMLPGEHGLIACRQLREAGNSTPIILASDKATDIERIIGLEMGADDYITKPANPREVLARIRAVLRRSRSLAKPIIPSNEASLKFGPYSIDPKTRSLAHNTEITRLTCNEFAVLWGLASNNGTPLTRLQIAQLNPRGNRRSSDRSVDLIVFRLRKIIEKNPENPIYLQTARGIGYVFCGIETSENSNSGYVFDYSI